MSTHNDHGDYYHRDVPHHYTEKLEKENSSLLAELERYKKALKWACQHPGCLSPYGDWKQGMEEALAQAERGNE